MRKVLNDLPAHASRRIAFRIRASARMAHLGRGRDGGELWAMEAVLVDSSERAVKG